MVRFARHMKVVRVRAFFLFAGLLVCQYMADTRAYAAEALATCLTAAESPMYPARSAGENADWWNIASACDATDLSRESNGALSAADLAALRARAYWQLFNSALAREILTKSADGSLLARAFLAAHVLKVGRSPIDALEVADSVVNNVPSARAIDRLARGQAALFVLQASENVGRRLSSSAIAGLVDQIFAAEHHELILALYGFALKKKDQGLQATFSERAQRLPQAARDRVAFHFAISYGDELKQLPTWLCQTVERVLNERKDDDLDWARIRLMADEAKLCPGATPQTLLLALKRLNESGHPGLLAIADGTLAREPDLLTLFVRHADSVNSNADARGTGEQQRLWSRACRLLRDGVAAGDPVAVRLTGIVKGTCSSGVSTPRQKSSYLWAAAEYGDLRAQLGVLAWLGSDESSAQAVGARIGAARELLGKLPRRTGTNFLARVQVAASRGLGAGAVEQLLTDLARPRSGAEMDEVIAVAAEIMPYQLWKSRIARLLSPTQFEGYGPFDSSLAQALLRVRESDCDSLLLPLDAAVRRPSHRSADAAGRLMVLRPADDLREFWADVMRTCTGRWQPHQLFAIVMAVKKGQVGPQSLSDNLGRSRLALILLEGQGAREELLSKLAAEVVRNLAHAGHRASALSLSLSAKDQDEATRLVAVAQHEQFEIGALLRARLTEIQTLRAAALGSNSAEDLFKAAKTWRDSPFDFEFPFEDLLRRAANQFYAPAEFELGQYLLSEQKADEGYELLDRASRHGHGPASEVLFEYYADSNLPGRAYLYSDRMIAQHHAPRSLGNITTLLQGLGFRLDSAELINNKIDELKTELAEARKAQDERWATPVDHELYQLYGMLAYAYGTERIPSAREALENQLVVARRMNWKLLEQIFWDQNAGTQMIGDQFHLDEGGADVLKSMKFFDALTKREPFISETTKLLANLNGKPNSPYIELSNLAELFLAQEFKAEAIAAALAAEEALMQNVDLDSHYIHRTFRSCVLSKAARLLDSEGARQAAIALLKISIAELERVRNMIGASSNRLGICFAKQNEDIYRSLASLLLDQGRIGEAETVMARMYFNHMRDHVRSDRSDEDVTALLTEEQKLIDDLHQKSRRLLSAMMSRRATYAAELFPGAGRPGIPSAIANLRKDLFVKAQISKSRDPRGLGALPSDLATSRTAFIRYLVLANETQIIVARKAGIKRFTLNYGREQLKDAIVRFRTALDHGDPKALGRELYQRLISPLEEALPVGDVDTLVLQQDDILSYVPFSALHDGTRWLIQRFAVVSYFESKSSSPHPDGASGPKIAAFAMTQSRGSYPALPYAGEEVRSIMANDGKGVFRGVPFIDGTFTREALLSSVKQAPQLLHIATHFTLKQTAQDSVMLLGTGEEMTLTEIDSAIGSLTSVKLVALSACSTAVGGGRDVPSLALLLREKGAGAVMATLWSVNDRSTGQFMTRFYQLLVQNPTMPMPQVLRQAQLEMLGLGNKKPDGLPDRGGVPIGSSPQPRNTYEGYTHPFYWAPYVLFAGATNESGAKVKDAELPAEGMPQKSVVAVAPAAGGAPDASSGYVNYENRDLPGDDISKIPNVTLSDCVAACSKESKCQAYSFDRWNRYCFLKSRIGALTIDPRSVTGVRRGLPAVSLAATPVVMARYRGKTFRGGGYKTLSGSQFEMCESVCKDDQSCVAFTFDKKGRSCRLFNNTDEYFADSQADSGIKSQAP